jgi:DUF971 family protein/molybdopterin converting factor small subunit
MSEITPTHIAVHQKSREFEIHFNDGSEYHLSCQYLRVFSPSAEVKAAKNRGELIKGKEEVNINNVEPMGSYAVRIHFDDGHDTGVYSWKTLKELGERHESKWQQYQDQLEQASSVEVLDKSIVVLFFIGLVDDLGTERLQLELTQDIDTVAKLIQHLSERGEKWKKGLNPGKLTLTVNKQFCNLEQKLFYGDEIALVPKA